MGAQNGHKEEFAAALRVVEQTGRVERKDFLHELEAEEPPRE